MEFGPKVVVWGDSYILTIKAGFFLDVFPQIKPTWVVELTKASSFFHIHHFRKVQKKPVKKESRGFDRRIEHQDTFKKRE